ncbi:MAG: DMT family transporter [Chloroflexota bacterium]|nr:DMT family transporter [Chloroflexota bacterium]
MTALLYGIGAALGWGIADYTGAISSRRLGVFGTMFGMELLGTFLYAAALAFLDLWPALDVAQLPYAIALAIVGSASIAAFFRALAVGQIAVVSPIGSAYLAVTVVLVVVFLGERLSMPQGLAIGTTFIGVMLTSTDVRRFVALVRRSDPGVRLAVLAMLGFGCWAALLSAATRAQDGLATVLLMRVTSVVLFAALFALWPVARPGRFGVRDVALVTVVGTFDTLANVAYVLGVQSGFASVVATGSAVYPLLPAGLAIGFLGERLALNQYVGVVVLAAGLVALGVTSAG